MISQQANKYCSAVALVLVLGVVYWLYLPGLKGGFLFDDYANLEDLGTYGGVVDFETFKNFVLNGISGPLGRPISLASFLLDDNTWPADPQWFKATNLKIHLLSGLVLFWASLQLMRLLQRNEQEAVWVALLSASIWMMHPYMVSTTLYIIQRMAQLSALFMFAGLAAYLNGRIKFTYNEKSGYLWMSGGLILFTILAVLSKENGILLPFTVLAIESCLPKATKKLALWWKALFLLLPVLIVVVYILSSVHFTLEPLSGRRFSQLERLLTEPRIIWEYLYHLYVPRIEGRGLFQDGYVISKNLLAPPITLAALSGLLVCIGLVIKYRRRYPLWGIALLYFFTSHVLESTLLNLELYFEHRNYVASAFLFLPIAAGLVKLPQYIDKRLAYGCILLLFLVLGFLTRERVNLWSNVNRLEVYWAAATPDSPRARNRVGVLLLEQNKIEESKHYFEESVKIMPQSSLININFLLVKVFIRQAQESDFLESGRALKNQPFDAQAVKALRSLVEKVTTIDNREHYVEFTLALLDEANSNSGFAGFPTFQRLYFYLKGQLYLKLHQEEDAFTNYDQAISLYADTDAALSMVAEVANAGYVSQAKQLMVHTRKVFQVQPRKSLKRSASVYSAEIERISNILDLAEKSKQDGNSDANIEHSNSSEK